MPQQNNMTFGRNLSIFKLQNPKALKFLENASNNKFYLQLSLQYIYARKSVSVIRFYRQYLSTFVNQHLIIKLMFSLVVLVRFLFVAHFQDNFYRIDECQILVILEIRSLKETLVLFNCFTSKINVSFEILTYTKCIVLFLVVLVAQFLDNKS